MKTGLEDSCICAHFLEDMFKVNYVYVLLNKREETTLGTIQEFFKYVERR